MADIEEAEGGSEGRVREWLGRAIRAPRDPVWIADGTVSETWAPVSPVTGRLDAFRWKAPSQRMGTAGSAIDADAASRSLGHEAHGSGVLASGPAAEASGESASPAAPSPNPGVAGNGLGGAPVGSLAAVKDGGTGFRLF